MFQWMKCGWIVDSKQLLNCLYTVLLSTTPLQAEPWSLVLFGVLYPEPGPSTMHPNFMLATGHWSQMSRACEELHYSSSLGTQSL